MGRTLGLAVTLLTLLVAATLPSISAAETRTEDHLADMSIEELMNESVTSVSKREQRLGDVASAITVLSNEDIHRSGATTVAEALRLVPGMNVAAVNAREWAISARGFNGVFANKLLVMVDGRAVYKPLSSGVFWDLEQIMLEDVDRIEAIRGPGATIWGANAVNGVVNVVTRSARDTQGGLVYAGAGDLRNSLAGVRLGAQVGKNTYYRIFGSYISNDQYRFSDGQPANDGWSGWHGGFRMDHYVETDTHLTFQGDLSTDKYDNGASEGYNVNSLVRYTRALSERSSVEVQAFYDRTDANEARRAHPLLETYDLTAQQTFGVGERHNLIWGLSGRFLNNSIKETNREVVIRTPEFNQRLYSAFVQDEIQVIPDQVILTSGVKLEHNTYTDFEVQPSIRIAWKPTPDQTAWAAVSRAVRTPAGSEAADVFGVIVGPPFVGPNGGLYLPTVVGNGRPRAEVLVAYELGYRIQPARNVSVDVATFYNDYSKVIDVNFGDITRFVSGVPLGTAEMPFSNLISAETYGGELSITFSASESWRLMGGYSLLLSHFVGPSGVNPSEQENGAPKNQVILRSSYDFNRRTAFDFQMRGIGKIEGVPGYVTADVRLAYRPTEQLELSLVGQNLFDGQHPEQGPTPITWNSELPRSFHAKISWQF